MTNCVPTRLANASTNMDTKRCRHCKEPMQADARVCPHCRSSQWWWGSQRDPRFAISWIVVFLLIFLGFMYYFPRHAFSDDEPVAAPRLEVSDVSTRVVTTPQGSRLFVLGTVRNASSHDASRVWFRVRIVDGAGKLLDTMLLQDPGLVVPGGKAVPFRVSDLMSTSSADPGRVDVAVERARPASRWD